MTKNAEDATGFDFNQKIKGGILFYFIPGNRTSFWGWIDESKKNKSTLILKTKKSLFLFHNNQNKCKRENSTVITIDLGDYTIEQADDGFILKHKNSPQKIIESDNCYYTTELTGVNFTFIKEEFLSQKTKTYFHQLIDGK